MPAVVDAGPASVVEVINKQIANWGVLYVKLHNYHWYVKGKQFYTLHEKFEELYDEAAAYLDELAERVLAIRGKPIATMSEMLALSSIKEAVGGENADQMVRTIIADFQTMIGELRRGLTQAEEAGDETTGDMILDMLSSLEKHVWMLESFIG
jgi:starvation-inducible DNA-binding protein